ncbi:MAG: hypothetical protein CM1200mP18_19150 [Gammaproteobacteria bacterium]|nr:MAG: hypothetical protein CM1200mP18_19150 [Gammaproteobacteria bacterium]
MIWPTQPGQGPRLYFRRCGKFWLYIILGMDGAGRPRVAVKMPDDSWVNVCWIIHSDRYLGRLSASVMLGRLVDPAL